MRCRATVLVLAVFSFACPERTMSLEELGPNKNPHAVYGRPDRQFGALELRDRLDKALARLPVEARFLIAGYYFGERKYEEMAEALKTPIGTVKTRLHSEKRRLRELLEHDLT